ncbi:S1 family peptidase [Dactylosporangium sp. CA-092794]|uniref:S1 family peptidase n=1 Tax=Dactylosporangium sp. CA-092794 TaxID=3239929 RepID=UPI003D8D703B
MRQVRRPMILAVLAAIVAAMAAVVFPAGPAAAIVGGSPAPRLYAAETAVQVVFPGLGTGFCTGVMVTRQWMLVAGHCASEQVPVPVPVAVPGAAVTARVGSLDRTSGGVLVTGEQVYLPPGWAWGTNWPAKPVSDYALVKLTSPVPGPVAQLATVAVPEGGPVLLTGWGLDEFPPAPGAEPARLLQQRDAVRLPAAACADGPIGIGEFCVSKGTCFGDSGGPALQQAGTGWAVVGTSSRETSETNPCSEPSVYTDLTYPPLRAWVWSTILHPAQPQPYAQDQPAPADTADAAARARIVDRLKLHLVQQ